MVTLNLEIPIRLSRDEARLIVECVEIAILARGSSIARHGVPLQDKIALATVAAQNQEKNQPTQPNVGGEPTQS